MTANETVREVCAEMRTYKHAEAFVGDECDFVDITGELADRILSAHEREMAAKDAEIARLKECHCEYALPDHGCMAEDKHFHKTVELERKVALLERALKPVMECSDELDIDSACAFAEHCISGDRCTCYGGKRCWVKFLHAVREAQRIMQEGEEK